MHNADFYTYYFKISRLFIDASDQAGTFAELLSSYLPDRGRAIYIKQLATQAQEAKTEWPDLSDFCAHLFEQGTTAEADKAVKQVLKGLRPSYF